MQKQNNFIILFIIGIVFIVVSPLYSSPVKKSENQIIKKDSMNSHRSYYITLGFGNLFEDITPENSFDYNYRLKINYRNQSNVVSLLYLRNEELGILLENNEISYSNLITINYGRIMLSI